MSPNTETSWGAINFLTEHVTSNDEAPLTLNIKCLHPMCVGIV